MGWLKKLTAGSIKVAKATNKGINKVGAWQDRQQVKALAAKRKELARLKVEANIAEQKARLRKHKPKDPFDWDL